MKYICHRANSKLKTGYDGYEVDIVCHNDKLYIGHDKPLRELKTTCGNVFYHAKDAIAYKKLRAMGVKCFYHENDGIAIVSNGYYWTTKPENVCKNTIFMDVKDIKYSIREINQILKAYAICSDNINDWKILFGYLNENT